MKRYIMVFKNNFDAVDTEKKLKAKQFNIMVMPTPTQITQSCGVSIIFNEDELSKINELIESNYINYKNIYEIEQNKMTVYR